MHPFTLKYKPVKTNEIIGQEIAIKKLKKFISDYKKQKKKAWL